MRCLSVALVLGLLATGCSAQPAQAPAPFPPAAAVTDPVASAALHDLDGSAWRFIEVAGARVPADVTATLSLRHGHASGKAGCNAYGAAYHVDADGSTRFTQSLSTKMACLQPAGVMRVERGIFAAFRLTTTVVVRDGVLVLLDAAGKPLAKLAPQSP